MRIKTFLVFSICFLLSVSRVGKLNFFSLLIHIFNTVSKVGTFCCCFFPSLVKTQMFLVFGICLLFSIIRIGMLSLHSLCFYLSITSIRVFLLHESSFDSFLFFEALPLLKACKDGVCDLNVECFVHIVPFSFLLFSAMLLFIYNCLFKFLSLVLPLSALLCCI